MSPACKLLQSLTSTMSLLRVHGIACRSFSRAMKRPTTRLHGMGLKHRFGDNHLQRRTDPMTRSGASRRYDDNYLRFGSYEPINQGTSNQKSKSRSRRDLSSEERIFEENLLSPEIDQFDLDSHGFDPRYDDEHYRKHRRMEERMELRDQRDSDRTARHLPSDWYLREYKNDRLGKEYWHSYSALSEMPAMRVADDDDDEEDTVKLPDNFKRFDELQKRRWAQRNKPVVNIKMPGQETKATYKWKENKNPEGIHYYTKSIYGSDHRVLPKHIVHPFKARDEADAAERKAEEAARMKRLDDRRRKHTIYDEKRLKEYEDQFWHRWDNCPDERGMLDVENDDESDSRGRRLGDSRPSFDRPKFDSNRRRYQTATASSIAPPMSATTSWEPITDHGLSKRKTKSPAMVAPMPFFGYNDYASQARSKKRLIRPPQKYGFHSKTRVSRKLSGLEKQYNKVWVYKRLDDPKPADTVKSSEEGKMIPSSSIYKREFKPNILNYGETNPKTIVPLPTIKRQCFGNRCNQNIQPQKKDKTTPPRYKMSIRKFQVNRPRAPIKSYADRMSASPIPNVPRSEYTGYTKPTMCDMWYQYSKEILPRF